MPQDKPAKIANGGQITSSNFYITINTNHRVKLVDNLTKAKEEYYKRFEQAWQWYFDQSPNEWLTFLQPGDNTENFIKHINIDARGKLQSSRRSMIHAHMLIQVKHYSKIHLNLDKLRKYLSATMGNHIHIDLVTPGLGKEDLKRICAYIHKEEPGPAKDITENKTE